MFERRKLHVWEKEITAGRSCVSIPRGKSLHSSRKGYLLYVDIIRPQVFNYRMGWEMMFGKKSALSKIIKVLIYGAVNFGAVLGLMHLTSFNSQSELQGQLPQILIIIVVIGVVNYIMMKQKF